MISTSEAPTPRGKETQPMPTQLSALVLLAALSGGTRESMIYEDYKEAWRAGRAQNLPVLVILNPGADSEASPVNGELLLRTKHRRKLLEKYVVAVIDTSTTEGQAAHKLFQSPALLRARLGARQAAKMAGLPHQPGAFRRGLEPRARKAPEGGSASHSRGCQALPDLNVNPIDCPCGNHFTPNL